MADKPWHLREFSVADLDGNQLRVFYDFAWEAKQAILATLWPLLICQKLSRSAPPLIPMNFDPTPGQQAIVDRARAVSKRIRSVAAAIDKAGRVPEELTQVLLGKP